MFTVRASVFATFPAASVALTCSWCGPSGTRDESAACIASAALQGTGRLKSQGCDRLDALTPSSNTAVAAMPLLSDARAATAMSPRRHSGLRGSVETDGAL